MPRDLLFLIGSNGSGKSSTLQALAFIHYFASGNPKDFFLDRQWRSASVRSRAENGLGSVIEFEVLLEVDRKTRATWTFRWGLNSQRLVSENIWIQHSNKEPERILHFQRARPNAKVKEGFSLESLRPQGSLLALLEPAALSQENEEVLAKVHQWGLGVTSLELLSPIAMRKGGRGTNEDIGPRGERLAGFLAGLKPENKDRLIRRLSRFYPVNEIETTKKRAGWVDVKVAEKFKETGNIQVAHMSDGFLRLLALCSIPEFDDSVGVVLLDEVEDGIEPHILPDLIRKVATEAKAQLIMTSHSPLLINFFDPDEICVMARSDTGASISKSVEQLDLFEKGSEYLGSGEIWANTKAGILNKEIVQESKRLPLKARPVPNAQDISTFMGGA